MQKEANQFSCSKENLVATANAIKQLPENIGARQYRCILRLFEEKGISPEKARENMNNDALVAEVNRIRKENSHLSMQWYRTEIEIWNMTLNGDVPWTAWDALAFYHDRPINIRAEMKGYSSRIKIGKFPKIMDSDLEHFKTAVKQYVLLIGLARRLLDKVADELLLQAGAIKE